MGGAERNTLDLMRAVKQMGHEPHLATLTSRYDGPLAHAPALDGIARHDLDAARIYDIRAWPKFASLLRRERFDCVHVQDSYATFLALIARRVLAVPTLVSRHTLRDPVRTTWDRTRQKILNSAAALAFDRAILVAKALEPSFTAQCTIPLSRTAVIHNGAVATPAAAHNKASARTELGWQQDAKVILMAAVLRPGKGHVAMLNAMRLICQRYPGAKLMLAGEGPMRRQLEDEAVPLGASVYFLGERTDVGRLMTACDIVVLPSESEALPMVLLEAATAGRPVVASRVGGVPEIVDDGVTGCLVPPRDVQSLASAILRLFADEELLQTLGRNARTRAEREFSIERQAERTLALYREVIGEHALSGGSRTVTNAFS